MEPVGGKKGTARQQLGGPFEDLDAAGDSFLRLIASLLLFSLAGGCSVFPGARVWRQTGPEVPELSVLDATMRGFMVSHRVSAGALAITYQSRLVFARGYSWTREGSPATDPQALFRIASLSKPVTSAAVLKLVEDGQLRLDEKVVDILSLGCPEGLSSDPNLKEVTILHLLQHLGGWDRAEAFDPMFQGKKISRALGVPQPISQADIITFMNGQPLQHKPGTKYAYSNYGYCLLGRVIERRTGMAYEDYVKKEVLSPLGITGMKLGCSRLEDRILGEVTYESKRDAAYGAFNLDNMDSHGGWLASAPDLARFAAAFDKPRDCSILSAESITTMFALPETIAADDYKRGERYYACGWSVRDYGAGRRNTWHTGSLPGTYTFMARWSSGVNCVVLFNKRGTGFTEIDPLLSKAAKSVTVWPKHDLFGEMLQMCQPSVSGPAKMSVYPDKERFVLKGGSN
jgi:CubicO group peptidase (beta-lactamase class C family)